VVDGAAALLLTSEQYMKDNNMTPRGRIVATANMGDCPTLMLNAPVPAAHKVLKKAGLKLEDIDLFEINEAFAVVLRSSFAIWIWTAKKSTSAAALWLWAIRLQRPVQFLSGQFWMTSTELAADMDW